MAIPGQYFSNIRFPLTQKPLTHPDKKEEWQDIFNLQNSFRLLLQEMYEPSSGEGGMVPITLLDSAVEILDGTYELPPHPGRMAVIELRGEKYLFPLYYYRSPQPEMTPPSYDFAWPSVKILLPLDDSFEEKANGYQVDAVNSPTFVEDTPWGYGKSLLLGGNSLQQFLRIHVDDKADILDKSYTVEMWIKFLSPPSVSGPPDGIFGRYPEDPEESGEFGSPALSYVYSMSKSLILSRRVRGTDSYQHIAYSAGYKIDDGEWHHVAVAYRHPSESPKPGPFYSYAMYFDGKLAWEEFYNPLLDYIDTIDGPWLIGSVRNDGDQYRTNFLHALVSNFRLSVGGSRYYSETFPVPSKPFPTSEILEARYWRVYVNSVSGASDTINISRIEFEPARLEGKPGSVICSTEDSPDWSAEKAFDPNTGLADGWRSVSGDTSGAWIGFVFDDPVGVVETFITPMQGDALAGAPRNVSIQFSLDGLTWETLVSALFSDDVLNLRTRLRVTAATVLPI